MTSPYIKYLAYEETPLGLLCLREREHPNETDTIITEVTLNHEFLMSSYHTASEKALSTQALNLHSGKKLKVLIGGLGLGYTAYEALKSDRVLKVDVIEYLPQVIGWLDEELFPLAQKLKADSRLHIIQNDIYKYLASRPHETYDLILIDVDHSPEENLHQQNTSFYSETGLIQAKKHLSVNGVLAVWSYASSNPFSEVLKQVFKQVIIEEISFENTLVNEIDTDWLFLAQD